MPTRFAPIVARLLVLMPLFWTVGLDRLVWYILPAVFVLGVVQNRGRFTPVEPTGGMWMLTLLLCGLLASINLHHVPTERLLVYIRELLAITVGVTVLFSHAGGAAEVRQRDAEELAKALAIFGVATSAMALVAWVLFLDFSYVAPLGRLLGLGESTFGNALLKLEEGHIGGVRFYRVKALFITANVFAMVLSVTGPMCLLMAIRMRRHLYKAAWTLGFLATFVATLLTGSRAVNVLTLGGMVLFAFLSLLSRVRPSLRLLFATAALLGGGGFVLVAMDYIEKGAELVIEAREQSSSTRFKIYEESFQAGLEQPLGHGVSEETEFDAGEAPLGSHSTYVGMLYKYGWLGFVAHIALILTLIWRWFTGYLYALRLRSTAAIQFFAATGWALSVNVLHQAVIDLYWTIEGFGAVVSLWLCILLQYRAVRELAARSSPGAVRAMPRRAVANIPRHGAIHGRYQV
jgi:hypothetical protein